MARAQSTDFLATMRFHVIVTGQDGGVQLVPPGRADAGFANVATPEVNVEPVEYKEGVWVYTRKYPGNPSMGGEITMQRGVTRSDSTFWDWLRRVIEGTGEYRADLDIEHYHREKALTRGPALGSEGNLTSITKGTPARVYHVRECFPTRHKVAADFDATASEISLMDLDVAYEHFEVEERAGT